VLKLVLYNKDEIAATVLIDGIVAKGDLINTPTKPNDTKQNQGTQESDTLIGETYQVRF